MGLCHSQTVVKFWKKAEFALICVMYAATALAYQLVLLPFAWFKLISIVSNKSKVHAFLYMFIGPIILLERAFSDIAI